MAKYVRARGGVILIDKESGAPIVPSAGEMFESSHPIVKAHPDAFISEEDAFSEQEAARLVPPTEIAVEEATANPGERRSTKRK
jgi:hypothetical protein